MTKRTRTSIFLLLGAIFALGAPVIILYSQGYRFDWETRKLSQAGAFYFTVIPTRAEIIIDEKSIGRTAPVLGTTLTKNFSPGTHAVHIQKEGYHPWKKYLEIKPKTVTEAKRIILFPLNPSFIVLQQNIQHFWPAPNGKEILLQKPNLPGNKQNTWVLILWNTETNEEYPLYESTLARDEILNIDWASDSDSFLLSVNSQEQAQNFVQSLDRNLLLSQQISGESLRIAAQLREKYTPDLLIQSAAAFVQENERLVWLDSKGILWLKTSASAEKIQLNKKPIALRAETQYGIHEIQNEFFVQESNALFILNRQTEAFEEFFAPFHEMVLSPDKRKLAILSGKELWLYFLKEDREQPSHTQGERMFLTRFSEDISNLTWVGSHYLLFSKGNTIMASEIDNRDRLNIIELVSFPNPTFFWQNSKKTLLVHSDSQLHASEKLLP